MMQDWESLTGISSVVIALCALVFTIWAGWLTHKHNKLSVKPHLTTCVNRRTELHQYGIEIVNNGLGPAVIDSFVVKLDGNEMKGHATEPIESILKALFVDSSYKYEATTLDVGYSMPSNEKRPLVTVQFLEPFTITPEDFEEKLSRCELLIEYSNYYGDSFTYSWESSKNTL